MNVGKTLFAHLSDLLEFSLKSLTIHINQSFWQWNQVTKRTATILIGESILTV